LYHNEISSIPPEIGNLTNLDQLSFHYNEISSIPPEIGNLTNLEYLLLQHNSMGNYPAGTFSNLTVVTNLEIHYNGALGVADIDQVLSDLANDNLPNRSSWDGSSDSNPANVDLTNTARPTNGSSNADYQALEDAGWTVSIDT
jgi:internalin A